MGLREYRRKRDFRRTPEPAGRRKGSSRSHRFVIHKHAATRLHYDLRLQLEGTLKSWAVPKGPSLDPAEKRLAVHVEDHPLEYAAFEGTIPKGEYGAGPVIIWDRGTWEPVEDAGDGYRRGRLKFILHGEKLHGRFNLVRMGGRAGEDGKNWLLFKDDDDEARTGRQADIVALRPESVASGRTIEVGKKKKRPASRTSRPVPAATGGAARSRSRGDTAKRPAPPAEAPRAPMPPDVAMQLATAVTEAPAGDAWLHEIKFDGYRALVRVSGGRASLMTRGGKDWSARFSELAAAAAALPVRRAILDGEIVRVDRDGRTSFQELQNSLVEGRTRDLSCYVFDLLYLDGHDLRKLPLETRKRTLAAVCAAAGPESRTIRYSDHVVGDGPKMHEEACRRGLEGIISKRRDRPWRPGRGTDWLKVKCAAEQELVIGGFTEPTGSRRGLGALLLGVHEDGKLVYAGRVGTGFNDRLLEDLRSRLDRLEIDASPFADFTGRRTRGTHWVRPALAAQVGFTEWTSDGRLRHPVFHGLREDKDVREIVREKPRRIAAAARDGKRGGAPRAPGAARKDGPVKVAGVTLTNPDKVLYPEQGITKKELALYYASIAERMLPHLADRPLTLLRCPEGHRKDCFYQKHAGATVPESIRRISIKEEKGEGVYLTVDTIEGLVSLAQMGVLEIHTWGSRAARLENPDRMTFDLDPDPELPWARVIETAILVRDRLSDLGLRSFLKTTGGKGLHVVVPLRARNTWQEVRDFSRGLAVAIVRDAPDRYTATMSRARRKGKIFIDYLRNVRGATAVTVWSTRARPGAPVSTPLRWEELTTKVRSDAWTIRNLPSRLARLRSDPWKGYDALRQTITASMRKSVPGV